MLPLQAGIVVASFPVRAQVPAGLESRVGTGAPVFPFPVRGARSDGVEVAALFRLDRVGSACAGAGILKKRDERAE